VTEISFVRTETLPELPPPVAEQGMVKWLRENLFSSVASGILTIVALWAIYKFSSVAVPWVASGVWNTESLAACRDVLDGARGACFSVLTERWNQLLFGISYPAEHYWRPTMAFVLLFFAAAPVLFFDLPRKLLFFTGLYPFIAYWLIWGGSVFSPLGILVSTVAAAWVFKNSIKDGFAFSAALTTVTFVVVTTVWFWLCFDHDRPNYRFLAWLFSNAFGIYFLFSSVKWAKPEYSDNRAFVVMVGFFIIWWIFVTPQLGMKLFPVLDRIASVSHSFSGLFLPLADFASIEAVPSRNMGGFMLNMILGTVCVSLSLPLGIILALGRQSNMPVIKAICVVFIEFIRGVPLITLLFVANVVLSYFFPPDANIDLVLRVIIMITLFSAAYIAEVIRGGLAALPIGQYEAADSLGLDYPQAMRLIILPQALKISIPGIVNVSVGLFKDTTLVSVISMFDLVGAIRGPILASTEWNGVYWELFMFASVLFFVVCYGISQYSQWLERRLATDHR